MQRRGAIILAGGKSTRLGVNKAFIKIAGKPLLRHVVDKASKVASEIVVVISKDGRPEKFEKILPRSIKVLTDKQENGSPIIGMMTGMESLTSEYTATLSGDTPLINENVLEYLFCKVNQADAAVPSWSSGWIEPLQAVYRVRSMLPAITATLKAGESRPFNAIKKLNNVIYVPVKEIMKIDRELLTFTNINTPKDLSMVRRLVSKTEKKVSAPAVKNLRAKL